MTDQLTIVRTPEGDAPEWVRQAWIGLTLTTLHASGPKRYHYGARPISPSDYIKLPITPLTSVTQSVEGYAVPSKAALDILEQTNASAAAWWKDNAPHLLDPEQTFIFDSQACDLGGKV